MYKPTLEEQIEENYINGNLTDAKKLIKRLKVAERKEFAVNAMYITYNSEDSIKSKHYSFAKFLIENI